MSNSVSNNFCRFVFLFVNFHHLIVTDINLTFVYQIVYKYPENVIKFLLLLGSSSKQVLYFINFLSDSG